MTFSMKLIKPSEYNIGDLKFIKLEKEKSSLIYYIKCKNGYLKIIVKENNSKDKIYIIINGQIVYHKISYKNKICDGKCNFFDTNCQKYQNEMDDERYLTGSIQVIIVNKCRCKLLIVINLGGTRLFEIVKENDGDRIEYGGRVFEIERQNFKKS
jgi:hypothetical protein